MRDYVSNDVECAAHLAAMDEEFPVERPEPADYHDLGGGLPKAQRAALARVQHEQMIGGTR